ncbi:BLUF domain-containing protein [Elongatibacter sediminis]|uniref:BLUF domain-containing protein n=1 Tax=Elongatibacter sediminis TaxID=3119006 RepID=A0AAW9RFB3_9GAMM
MPGLHAIVYVSSAVHLMQPDELEQLLARARRKNQKLGVTGLLLYCDGNFMQYIEGEEENLRKIFKTIQTDPRHQGLVKILDQPVNEREFADWNMGFAIAHETELSRLTGASWETGGEDGRSASPRATGRKLLRAFWERQMRAEL